MMKSLFLVPTFLALVAISASAQFGDYPAGYDNKPKDLLKGPVHTVLTIEQRDEHVFSTTVEVYDDKGRFGETLSSNANIEVHSGKLYRLGGKSIYLYDGSGKLSKVNRFNPQGEASGYELYKYDNKGRLIESNIFNSEGKDVGYKKYLFSSDKREVEAVWSFYEPGGKSSVNKSVLAYDDKGRWISRTMNLGDKEPVTFDYDADGNFVKETNCCKYNFWHTYTYKFDKYGNWIEREDTYFQKGKDGGDEARPGWMNVYRIITYYPEQKTNAK